MKYFLKYSIMANGSLSVAMSFGTISLGQLSFAKELVQHTYLDLNITLDQHFIMILYQLEVVIKIQNLY